MAADYRLLTNHLRHFYDFTGKVVLLVGAARRQLLDPCFRTKKVIAIDQNVEALQELHSKTAAAGAQNHVEIIGAEFETVLSRSDVADYPELLAKLAPQGHLALQRAERFQAGANIVIPMNCELVLL